MKLKISVELVNNVSHIPLMLHNSCGIYLKSYKRKTEIVLRERDNLLLYIGEIGRSNGY
jgi:hypothetical protein